MPFGYKPTIEDRRHQKLFAKFVRIERTKQNISLNELAKLIGIDSSYLSSIENAKRVPSEIVIESICDALDITFDLSLDTENECKELVRSCYNLLLNNDVAVEGVYKQLKDNNRYYSFAYPIILLADFLCDVLYKRNAIDDNKLQGLKELEDLEDESFKVVVTDFEIMAAYKNLNPDQVSELYLEKLKSFGRIDSSCLLGDFPLGLFYLHAATYFSDHRKLLDATQVAKDAQTIFQKHLYLKGMLAIKELNAKNYFELKNYERAIEEYKELAANALVSSNKQLVAMCYENIGSILYKSKKYDEANHFFNKALELDLNCKHARYYLVLSTYEMDEEKALKLINKYENFDNELSKSIIRIIKSIIQDDIDEIEKVYACITNDYSYASLVNDIDLILFRFYSKKSKYDIANIYATKLINSFID